MRLFAACLPGLEPFLIDEVQAIGATSVRKVDGGVAFEGGREAVYRANLECGLASHVLMRIESFPARGFAEVVRKTARVPWRELLLPDHPLALHVVARQSRLIHTGAIEERVRAGIRASLGSSPRAPTKDERESDHPLPRLHVRMYRDECTISLDTSGVPLHRRGWRKASGKAPLREDLARALVIASGWDRRSPLLDPFCGSGTIPIEAASLALNRAPGRGRRFAIESTALHDEGLLREVKRDTASREQPFLPAPIIGSDRDRGAIEAALSNADRAEIQGIVFDRAAVSASAWLAEPSEAPPVGALVTNPPYGRRVGAKSGLRSLYQSFGRAAQGLPDGWTTTLLTTDRKLAHAVGFPLRTAFLTRHGGLQVRALTGRSKKA